MILQTLSLPWEPFVLAGGAGTLWLGWKVVRGLRTAEPSSTSGREQYEPDSGLRSRLADGRTVGDVKVDGIEKRDPEGARKPMFRDDVSMMVLGMTGQGKSTFVKSRLQEWDFDGAIIAHALSNPGDENEFADFFGQRGQAVIRLSSRNSTHRWDPFLDFRQSMRDMESIAEGVFSARPVKATGWTEPARSMLICSLVVTSALYGDFSKLTVIIGKGPEWIVREVQKIDRAKLAALPLMDMDDGDRQTVFDTMINQIRPLLYSEIFDSELPRISLREYFTDPGQTVMILDNVREDRYARGFWRFLLQSGIDLSFATGGTQQFLLDEFDKLPEIHNLDELASAGRSAGAIGLLVAQDVHQLDGSYGKMHRSIWSNSPNRVCFRAGDRDTAELALSSLGVVEMVRESRTESTSTNPDGETSTSTSVSESIEEQVPILSGELTRLGVGEAFVQSSHGWWLADLSEPDLSIAESTSLEVYDQEEIVAADGD